MLQKGGWNGIMLPIFHMLLSYQLNEWFLKTFLFIFLQRFAELVEICNEGVKLIDRSELRTLADSDHTHLLSLLLLEEDDPLCPSLVLSPCLEHWTQLSVMTGSLSSEISWMSAGHCQPPAPLSWLVSLSVCPLCPLYSSFYSETQTSIPSYSDLMTF